MKISMKKKVLVILFLTLMSSFEMLLSQSSFSFKYDPAGNRIRRTVTVGGGTQKSLSIYDPNTGKVKDEKNLKSLEEKLGGLEITIYPNPNRGEMVVRIDNLPSDERSLIKVYEAGGRLILQKKKLQPYTYLDITHSPPGIYFLKIFIGKEVSEWKVIKK